VRESLQHYNNIVHVKKLGAWLTRQVRSGITSQGRPGITRQGRPGIICTCTCYNSDSLIFGNIGFKV
jgi:hypothetical protein